jgi:hypothetical protein
MSFRILTDYIVTPWLPAARVVEYRTKGAHEAR